MYTHNEVAHEEHSHMLKHCRVEQITPPQTLSRCPETDDQFRHERRTEGPLCLTIE